MTDRIVIPVSGGIDSLLLADRFRGAKLLFVDYGQPYVAAERRAVARLYDKFSEVTVRGMDTTEVFVPARNLMIALLAAQEADHVMLGGLADDNSFDQSVSAAKQMSRVLTAQCGRNVRVTMPLASMCKAQAVSQYLNVPFGREDRIKRLELTFSCYADTQDGPCGNCGACFRKWVALTSAGVDLDWQPTKQLIEDYLSKLHKYHHGRAWATLVALRKISDLVVIDIDGVITEEHRGHDYASRTARIDQIDALAHHHREGKWIVLHTARPEWDRAVTVKWLADHDVQYHSLLMNKPPASWLVDDLSTTEM